MIPSDIFECRLVYERRFRSGLQNINLLAYLNDVIILSTTLPDPQLCFLFDLNFIYTEPSAAFHTHLLDIWVMLSTKAGFHPSADKIAVVDSRASSKNVKQIMSFVQACFRFRRFIANSVDKARPLTNLTKKKR